MTNTTKTNEEIKIIVTFNQKGPQPRIFKWLNRDFKIEKINLIYEQRVGNDKIVYFSVSSQGNYFKLAFNSNKLKWYVEEVYHE